MIKKNFFFYCNYRDFILFENIEIFLRFLGLKSISRQLKNNRDRYIELYHVLKIRFLINSKLLGFSF